MLHWLHHTLSLGQSAATAIEGVWWSQCSLQYIAITAYPPLKLCSTVQAHQNLMTALKRQGLKNCTTLASQFGLEPTELTQLQCQARSEISTANLAAARNTQHWTRGYDDQLSIVMGAIPVQGDMETGPRPKIWWCLTCMSRQCDVGSRYSRPAARHRFLGPTWSTRHLLHESTMKPAGRQRVLLPTYISLIEKKFGPHHLQNRTRLCMP